MFRVQINTLHLQTKPLHHYHSKSPKYPDSNRLSQNYLVSNPTMDSADTFTLLPLHMHPQTKEVTANPSNAALEKELHELNALHRNLIAAGTPTGTPPPPVPVNPTRSAQIGKLRESGNNEFRKGHHAEAVKLYGLAIGMALGRPHWEPSGLVREEVSGLLSNRAQANMAQQNWAEGAVDAEASVEMKKADNAKGWWRRGKCLLEMGRLEEADAWVRQGLEFGASEPDLVQLKAEIEKRKAGSSV